MTLAVLACLALVLVPQGPPPASTEKDRAAAVTYLEETRRRFLKSIDALSEAQWTFKATPDRWSIAEVAEHIAVSDGTILQLISEKIAKGPKPATAPAVQADQKVIDAMLDRAQKAQAPEMLRPTHRWASREALTTDFLAARQKTIDYVKTTSDDLRGRFAPHPVLENLDGHQWVLLLAAHSARHTAQIEEVKQAPGYPAK